MSQRARSSAYAFYIVAVVAAVAGTGILLQYTLSEVATQVMPALAHKSTQKR
jgi:hypothetical protein